MAVFGFGSAASRRSVVAVAFAAVLGTAMTVQAQQAAAPAAAPAPQADPFKFETDGGGILWQVKAEKVAEFEAAWKEIRSKLPTSEVAGVKELVATLKLYKIAGDPGPQGVSYLFVADPASKALSYSPTFLLFETKVFPDADARRIFQVLQDASANISPLSLIPQAAQ
jgi:hypothetical protein